MNSYKDYQRNKDQQYLQAWENLTQEERDELKRLGISGAKLPSYSTDKPSMDSVIEKASQGLSETLQELEKDDPTEIIHATLRRILGQVLSQDNISLTFECLVLVTGIGYMGESMTNIAKRYGVTRACVSKRCVELTKAMNLKPSRAMRKLTARKVYEHRQHRILEKREQFSSNSNELSA